MSNELYTYPAVFDFEDDDGIYVEFPDLPGCFTCGYTGEEAIYMAQDILGYHLYDLENEDSNFPSPTPIDQMKCKPDQKIFLITVHMPSVRKEITEQLYQQRSKIMQFIDETFGKSRVTVSDFVEGSIGKIVRDNKGREWEVDFDDNNEPTCWFHIEGLIGKSLGFASLSDFQKNTLYCYWRINELPEGRWIVWEAGDYEVKFFDNKREALDYVEQKRIEEFGD